MVVEGVEYVIRLASGAGAARVAGGGGVVGGAGGRLALVAPDALCEGAGVVVVVLERRVGSAPCDLVGLRVPLGLKGWALGRLRLKRLKTGLGRF